MSSSPYATFEDAAAALACADAMNRAADESNAAWPDAEPMHLRIGMHLATVVVDDIDVYGHGVNVAARLVGLARPGEVVASIDVVESSPAFGSFVDLGDCYFKHIEEPVRAYRRGRGAANPRSPSVPSPVAPIAPPTLAVLTFRDEGDGLGAMLADETAAQLGAHQTVEVVSRMSTRRRGAQVADDLERALGPHYRLTGHIEHGARDERLRLRLTHSSLGEVVWESDAVASRQRWLTEPAAGLADACSAVMGAIQSSETGRARSKPLASLASYSLLLGGVRLMHRLSYADFERARELLEALVARHPRHPDGYAWLAKWHILRVHQGWSTDIAASAGVARDMARRALDHDDHCAVAMVVAGMVQTFFARQLDEAESTYARALALHPNEPLAWLLKGMVHAFRGEGDPAVRHTVKATQLSPLDPMRYYFDSLAASAHAAAGRYEDAVSLARQSLQANPMHASTWRILTIAYAMLDRDEEAREAADRMRVIEPDFSVRRFLERSPSADYPIGELFARALQRAGVAD